MASSPSSSSSSASSSKSQSLTSLNDSANINNSNALEQNNQSPQDEMKKRDESEFKFSNEPNLERLRAIQREFVNERDWNQYHTPRNLLLALVGEVGELAEIFQWKSEVPPGLTNWSEADREHVGQEMSDVLIYLIRLADVCKIDLPKVALDKIAMNKRKYPVEKSFGSNKKYDQL